MKVGKEYLIKMGYQSRSEHYLIRVNEVRDNGVNADYKVKGFGDYDCKKFRENGFFPTENTTWFKEDK